MEPVFTCTCTELEQSKLKVFKAVCGPAKICKGFLKNLFVLAELREKTILYNL